MNAGAFFRLWMIPNLPRNKGDTAPSAQLRLQYKSYKSSAAQLNLRRCS